MSHEPDPGSNNNDSTIQCINNHSLDRIAYFAKHMSTEGSRIVQALNKWGLWIADFNDFYITMPSVSTEGQQKSVHYFEVM